MEEIDEQVVNNSKYKQAKGRNPPQLQPYQWKKGQSGNIMGRPKGISMKEYAQQYLARMTDEERDAWLEGLSKETIWKMSEGNWRNDHDVQSGGKPLVISTSPALEKALSDYVFSPTRNNTDTN